MNIMDMLAGLLNPQQPQNRLAGAGQVAAGRFDDPGAMSDPGVQAILAGQRGTQQPAQAFSPPMAPQSAPMPQGAPAPAQGGGIGGMLGNLFNPGAGQKNQTIGWLTQQGLDEGTATLLAGNKPALQQYLLKRSQGADPKDALELEKLQLDIQDKRNPTTDDVREYQFAKQEGYKGSFADWRKGTDSLPSGVQEYEYAKAQGFPGTYQDWEASKKGGMSLQVDPATGAITFQQGGNIKPLTESQSKDTVYATRAAGALPIIDQFGGSLTSLPESAAGSIPGLGNYMKSKEFQQAEQAGKEFLQAILRKDTGAAIHAHEMDTYGSVYLPRPGDGPEVLAQKQASRTRALEAIKAGMPAQAILAQEKALANTPTAAPPSGDGVDLTDMPPPPGIEPEVWQHVPPERRKLWQ